MCLAGTSREDDNQIASEAEFRDATHASINAPQREGSTDHQADAERKRLASDSNILRLREESSSRSSGSITSDSSGSTSSSDNSAGDSDEGLELQARSLEDLQVLF
jgi:hypothetical protein